MLELSGPLIAARTTQVVSSYSATKIWTHTALVQSSIEQCTKTSAGSESHGTKALILAAHLAHTSKADEEIYTFRLGSNSVKPVAFTRARAHAKTSRNPPRLRMRVRRVTFKHPTTSQSIPARAETKNPMLRIP
jgi:hypothetical protein